MTDDDIIDKILLFEGLFVDNPDDHGGPTNFGITASDLGMELGLGRVATKAEVQAMTRQKAREIYVKRYIVAPHFDSSTIADDYLRWVVVDSGVLHGTRTATKWLQSAVGVKPDGDLGPATRTALASSDAGKVARAVLSQRIRSEGGIAARSPSQVKFLNGWLNRATDLLLEQ